MDRIKTGLAYVGGATIVVGLFALARQALIVRRSQAAQRRCARLEAELAEARAALGTEEDDSSGEEESKVKEKKEVKVYIDGCFDMMHFGHSNALRQARALGTYLVVGLISDEEIERNKGSAPVMPFEERLAALEGCKFVDEVLPNVKYDADEEFSRYLFEEKGVSFIVHGDDTTTNADGTEQYAWAKSLGRYKEFKRTEGVSTTDLVGRMLMMSREHHIHDRGSDALAEKSSRLVRARAMSEDLEIPEARVSTFLPTSRRIVQFSDGRAPRQTDTVVYVSGSWDLFNAGHIQFLKKAKSLGDFLLVGINDDDTVNTEHGSGFPIMNLHERALSVLQCKYVDEAIIGAPWALTQDMIKTMHISVVATGNVVAQVDGEPAREHNLGDPYAVAREMGILKEISSGSDLTARKILARVFDNRARFLKRYLKKNKSEQEYYTQNKTYVAET